MSLLLAITLTLANAQASALASAPTLAEARATLDEKRALYSAARAGGAPHAFVNYAQSPQAGNDGATVEQRITTAGAAFNLTDIASATPAALQAAADVRSAQSAYAAAERQERIKVIGLYADAVRTAEIASLREQLEGFARDDQRAARLRYDAGDAPRLDVTRADVALSKAGADLASARADASNARDALVIETQLADASLDLPPVATLVASIASVPNDAAAIERARTSRAEVSAAQSEVASERAAIALAQRAAAPAVTAQVGYATGIDTGTRVQGPAATLNLDLPLSGAARDRIAAEAARLRAAQARFDAAQRQAELDVRSALTSYRADRVAASAASHARAEAAVEARATLVGYRSGASSSLDVVDARRTYAQAAIDDITAQTALYEAAATLRIDLGEQP